MAGSRPDFDLDADHLPGKVRSYAEMLSNVKSETGKLLDFLLQDFGFLESNINIVFSGGRGIISMCMTRRF